MTGRHINGHIIKINNFDAEIANGVREALIGRCVGRM